MIKKKFVIILVLLLSFSMILCACDFTLDLTGTEEPSKTQKEDEIENGKLVNLTSFYDVFQAAYKPYEVVVNSFEPEDYYTYVDFMDVAMAGYSLAFGSMYDANNPDNKDGKFEDALLGDIVRTIEKHGKDITYGYVDVKDQDSYGDIKAGDKIVESGVADLESGYYKYEYTLERDGQIVRRNYEEMYVLGSKEVVLTGANGKLNRENDTKDYMYYVKITNDGFDFVVLKDLIGTDYSLIPLEKATTADQVKTFAGQNGIEVALSGKIVGETVTLD